MQFNDSVLLVIMGLGVDLIENDEKWRSLTPVSSWWRDHMPQWGPGCIEPGLVDELAAEIGPEALDALLQAIDDRCASFGAGVPAGVVNRLLLPEGVLQLGDFPVPFLLEGISQLRWLLAEAAT